MAGYVLLAFCLVYRFNSKLAMASLAASAFGFPAAESARPRYLIGGYACAVASGLLCAFLFERLPAAGQGDVYVKILFCAAAVFLTAFLMLILKLQHPPSAALALALVLEPGPWMMGVNAVLCIIVLCLLKIVINRLLARRCG